MDTLFKTSSTYSSLSLKDVIAARDHFHYHLMNKKNVVATAVGLYRIRKKDRWPGKEHPIQPNRSHGNRPRRTLFNSEVRPYSWPCVYVFVSEWEKAENLAKQGASDVVPKCLYLPDGRVIPVCVIEARKQHLATNLPIDPNRTPRNLFGPGAAIVNEDGQGLPRVGTAGCIARDSDRYYVLSNRHVVGEPGTRVLGLQPQRRPEIGVSAKKSLGREDFHEIYPGFASTNQYCLMDVGLVDLDDITQWKTAVPGISPTGPVLDLYDNSLTLKLTGMKVVGFGAVTGAMRGEIHGLFYRFKAMGGSEYIADFMIGPESYGVGTDVKEPDDENIALEVAHGDSGTVLFIEHQDDEQRTTRKNKKKTEKKVYYPFALLWGKQDVFDDGKHASHPFALATALSTALDRLDLDLVLDINADQDYIWGWVGHYAIGTALPSAVQLSNSPKLRKFIDKNLSLLTLTPSAALDNNKRVIVAGDVQHPQFVPLADVPDNVWKSNVNFYQVEDADGKKHRKPGPGSRGQSDNPNHFADIDLPYKNHKTFLAYLAQNMDDGLDPDVWLDYYDSVKGKFAAWSAAIGKTSPPESHWGALPFRIWQLFDAMVDAAHNGRQAEFLCAGGVLIHYVGDACQPLHTSYLSQGDPDRVVPRPRSTGNKLEADGVHSGYEDDMVNYGYQKKNLATKLAAEITRQENVNAENIAAIGSGKDAAKAFVTLVQATRRTIKPRDIIDKWVALKSQGASKGDRDEAMWAEFGTKTANCMARGTRYLARIWSGAWSTGGGDQRIGEGAKIGPAAIAKLYNDPSFVRSVRLDRYKSILKS
jgi:hypothetical protein